MSRSRNAGKRLSHDAPFQHLLWSVWRHQTRDFFRPLNFHRAVISSNRFSFDSMNHRMALSAESDQVKNFSWSSQTLVAHVMDLKVCSRSANGAFKAVDPEAFSSDAPPPTGSYIRIVVHKFSRSHHSLSFLTVLRFSSP